MFLRASMAALGITSALFAWSCSSDTKAPPGLRPEETLAHRPAAVTASATATPSGVCAPPYPTGPPTPDNVFCADPSPMSQAQVLDVIDGDTLDVSVAGTEERIRVFGIDTPERGEPCFREATRALEQLSGGDILLVPDHRNRDSSGRLLRYLYTPDGLSIDAVLVGAGLAHAWTRDGALRDALVELEERARTAGEGCLWR